LHRAEIASRAAYFGIGRWCGHADFFSGGTQAPRMNLHDAGSGAARKDF
jgi:hypothetical protein